MAFFFFFLFTCISANFPYHTDFMLSGNFWKSSRYGSTKASYSCSEIRKFHLPALCLHIKNHTRVMRENKLIWEKKSSRTMFLLSILCENDGKQNLTVVTWCRECHIPTSVKSDPMQMGEHLWELQNAWPSRCIKLTFLCACRMTKSEYKMSLSM